MTTNTGGSWTNITNDLPDVPADSFVKDATTGYLYVGTDVGVFISTNGGSNWLPFGTGLPSAPVLNIKTFINGSIRLLRAGTYGRGVWSIALASAAPTLSTSSLTMVTIPNVPQTQSITYTNTTAASVTINSISLSGANAANFSTGGNCGSTLAANTSCIIDVIFSPTAVNTSYNATLTIADSGSGSPRLVTLNGTSTDVTIVVSRPVRQRFDNSISIFITAGTTAIFDMTVGPVFSGNGASGNLPAATFDCTGAPAGATCSIIPGALQLGDTAGTTQVTLQTTRAVRSERLNTKNMKVVGTQRGSYNLNVIMHIGGYSKTVIIPVVVQ